VLGFRVRGVGVRMGVEVSGWVLRRRLGVEVSGAGCRGWCAAGYKKKC
jgi:hypothetical protein